jgi:hypothetical protein
MNRRNIVILYLVAISSMSGSVFAGSKVNGQCGAGSGTVRAKPTANLCALGAASPVVGGGPWSWSCAGVGGGTASSCKAELPPDITKPVVSDISISSPNLELGTSVDVFYTVKDAGGSGLATVEFWRSSDNKNWGKLQSIGASGNGPNSGKFTDKPTVSGKYYYGVHVADMAGNNANEGGALAVTFSESAKPSVSGLNGTKYKVVCADASICNSAWNDYHLVGYSGAPYKSITLTGDNLDKVKSVSISGSGYTASIAKKTKTSIDVTVSASSYASKPAVGLTLMLDNDAKLSKSVSLIPAINDYQLYGQCTWYAWRVMRKQNSQSEITAYSQGVPIQSNASTVNIPRANSIAMSPSQKHTGYIDTVEASAAVVNKDKSKTVKYTLKGHHANWKNRDSVEPFTADMTVVTSADGKSLTATYPKVGYFMTHVYY